MDCPKCNSENHVKHGKVGERQRYLCKNCGYKYTVSQIGKPMETKKMALKLYLEGVGFRAIGRVLDVSFVSAYNWVKKFGEEASETVEKIGNAPVIEMDELHTFVGVKKTTAGSGLGLTGTKSRS
jgi:transposase-like protein